MVRVAAVWALCGDRGSAGSGRFCLGRSHPNAPALRPGPCRLLCGLVRSRGIMPTAWRRAPQGRGRRSRRVSPCWGPGFPCSSGGRQLWGFVGCGVTVGCVCEGFCGSARPVVPVCGSSAWMYMLSVLFPEWPLPIGRWITTHTPRSAAGSCECSLAVRLATLRSYMPDGPLFGFGFAWMDCMWILPMAVGVRGHVWWYLPVHALGTAWRSVTIGLWSFLAAHVCTL